MSATPLDLRHAVLVTPGEPASGVERKAAALLADEVRARTGITWPQADAALDDKPAVVVARRDHLAAVGAQPPVLPPDAAEGCAVSAARGDRPVVFALGADDRGTLFAAGRLLRALRMTPGKIQLDPDLALATSPRYGLRGHQLGYRPKSNTYDTWDLARFEQYLRDLVVFGANAVEIIPSVTPDDVSDRNGLMPTDPWEMTVAFADLIACYGLIVRMWFPLTDADPRTPEGLRALLENRRRLFAACRRVDAVFVPGGDPGELTCDEFIPALEAVAGVLRDHHPGAQFWASPQGLDEENLARFYRWLREGRPDWLTGVVYGAWLRDTLPHLREMVPARYPVQDYPDITHCVRCQYPVPGWDPAFALALNREPINPRPRQYAHIHRLTAPHTVGFCAYSDGVNDDVNKHLWSVLAWDPEADVRGYLVEYGRYFIGPEFGEEIADGLLALEANWEGPLAGNEQVAKTLAHWQALERRAPRLAPANWRFQQSLFRAHADAYVQQRLERETRLERQALRALSRALKIGADAAASQARSLLARADTPIGARLLRRIHRLADDLRQSIGMQLSVARHGASAWDRGATLDTLGAPLNNRAWIEAELHALAGKTEHEKLRAIKRIVGWEDPGPGGFYDDLGDPSREPHLVREPGWRVDPGFLLTPHDDHAGPGPGAWAVGEGPGAIDPSRHRQSWQHVGQALFSAPLRLRYQGLDPHAAYRLRVVYAGRFGAAMRLLANGVHEIHAAAGPSDPITPLEFDLPPEATAGGTLELAWTLVTGPGVKVGRNTLITGPQVAEVWLVEKRRVGSRE